MTDTVSSVLVPSYHSFRKRKKRQQREYDNDEYENETNNNNMWNPTQENLLVRWDNICTVRAVMHGKTAQYYERWHFWISMIAIVLAGASGISSFANLSSSNDSNSSSDSNGTENCSSTNIGILIAASVMALISGILQSSKEFIRFDVLSTDHRKVMADYEALRMHLQEAASFPRDIRESEYPVTEFFSTVSSRLQTLQTIASTIPDHILNQHIQQAKTILQPEEHRLVIAPPINVKEEDPKEPKIEINIQKQQEQEENKTTSMMSERSTTSLNMQQRAEDFTRFTDDIEKRVQEKLNNKKS
jgi:hypothetical protein